MFSRKHQAYPKKNTFFSNRSRTRTSDFFKISAEPEAESGKFFETFGTIFYQANPKPKVYLKDQVSLIKSPFEGRSDFQSKDPLLSSKLP